MNCIPTNRANTIAEIDMLLLMHIEGVTIYKTTLLYRPHCYRSTFPVCCFRRLATHGGHGPLTLSG